MNSYVLTPATGVVVNARQKREPAIVVFAGGLNTSCRAYRAAARAAHQGRRRARRRSRNR